LPTQDLEFMAQHQQFDVFHMQATAAANKRTEQSPHSKVEKREGHAADPPKPRPKERRHQFWRPSGGQILLHPGAYFGRVFLPSLVSWLAGLGVTAVFLAAYAIPVTFHTVMAVTGGNSIANVTSVTPGGAGVQQAFNVASLKGVTDSTTATAYSTAQQLVTTAWDILFGIVTLVWAFGWRRGRSLVEESYAQAREKEAEQRAARRARKLANERPREEPGSS
jgi:uncharacterized membrane protein YbhN (UPF0104 family)